MTRTRMMINMKDIGHAGPSCVAAAILLSISASAAEPQGFGLEVHAHATTAPAAALRAAVIGALPEMLTDPQLNFTRDQEAVADRTYRIVLAVHPTGWEMPDPCGSGVSLDVPATHLADINSSKAVSATLCENDIILTQGTQRSTGMLAITGPGFKHLVKDVVQQLFPIGFGELPR